MIRPGRRTPAQLYVLGILVALGVGYAIGSALKSHLEKPKFVYLEKAGATDQEFYMELAR
jgi:hypothetical protein